MYCIRSKSLFFLFEYITASETWHTQLPPGVKPVDLCIFPCFIQCLNCHYPNKMTVLFTVLSQIMYTYLFVRRKCTSLLAQRILINIWQVMLYWWQLLATYNRPAYTDELLLCRTSLENLGKSCFCDRNDTVVSRCDWPRILFGNPLNSSWWGLRNHRDTLRL